MSVLKREPAVLLGILFAAVMAALQSLAGNGIIGQDVVDTIASAFDPSKGGWAIPLITGLITRQFVFSPAKTQEVANLATFQPPGTVVDIGKPPDASPPLPPGG